MEKLPDDDHPVDGRLPSVPQVHDHHNCKHAEEVKHLKLMLQEALGKIAALEENAATASATSCPLKTPDKTAHNDKREANDMNLSENGNQECPVCLCPLEKTGRALFRTSCGHVFHFQCVKECVLTSQNGCPMCRKSFRCVIKAMQTANRCDTRIAYVNFCVTTCAFGHVDSEMTPPRTPLTQRSADTIFPGFTTARAAFTTSHHQANNAPIHNASSFYSPRERRRGASAVASEGVQSALQNLLISSPAIPVRREPSASVPPVTDDPSNQQASFERRRLDF